jgi:hypothetical protein
MEVLFNEIAEFIIYHNLMIKKHSYLYMIPCFIIVMSFFVHLQKIVEKSPYMFTKLLCQLVIFGLLFECFINIEYIIDVWDKVEYVDGTNIMWISVMIVGGIIQLVSPLIIKAAEKYYLNKLKKNEFREY